MRPHLNPWFASCMKPEDWERLHPYVADHDEPPGSVIGFASDKPSRHPMYTLRIVHFLPPQPGGYPTSRQSVGCGTTPREAITRALAAEAAR